MILNNIQLEELFKDHDMEDLPIGQWLELIQTYIFEKKGQDPGTINHPLDILNWQLYLRAQRVVYHYYKDKYYENHST